MVKLSIVWQVWLVSQHKQVILLQATRGGKLAQEVKDSERQYNANTLVSYTITHNTHK